MFELSLLILYFFITIIITIFISVSLFFCSFGKKISFSSYFILAKQRLVLDNFLFNRLTRSLEPMVFSLEEIS